MSNIIGQLNDSGEWYTPYAIIDLVKQVLGHIDLDPASSPEANKQIGARKIYTIEDDGLSKTWIGNVFVNPPYTGGTPKWAAKFREQTLLYGTVKNGIILTNANFGYHWYNDLIYHSKISTVVLKDLVEFIPADGQPATHAKRATSLCYYGNEHNLFNDVFKPFGKILL
jgi:ParB family chromosome partitioning protein